MINKPGDKFDRTKLRWNLIHFRYRQYTIRRHKARNKRAGVPERGWWDDLKPGHTYKWPIMGNNND